MDAVSLLNDVLGPVMRGPSSSHTAGAHHLARLALGLFGQRPDAVGCAFDPAGSYGQVYRQQGVDLAFACGVLERPLTDPRFFDALADVERAGIRLAFEVRPLRAPDHPNTVEMVLEAAGAPRLELTGRSTGGGAIEITWLDGWPVHLTGDTHAALVDVAADAEPRAAEIVAADGQATGAVQRLARADRVLLTCHRVAALSEAAVRELQRLEPAARVYQAPPVAFVKRGAPLFTSGATMVDLADARGWSLGRTALAYEAALLGVDEATIAGEMRRRFEIMRVAVAEGLTASPRMQLLEPSAGRVFEADARGALPVGGLHTRAAARAMAVMHVNGAMGVVCAAPTGGSAGVVPGTLVTLVEETGLDGDAAVRALLAASAIGGVVAMRATFAAEVAGCQVEIGAAGAMAAAAVVEAGGGTARQAADAAAIAFQNTMGMVCDLVQGMVEIPCHTRNAVAASSAFVCADLVMGGYHNPVPLDETLDAVMAVGRSMSAELRCTAKGGLAVTPSALKLVGRPRRTGRDTDANP